MDYLNLYRDHGVTLQFGGSDQWGNITGGVELIRRADGGQAHAFATPLITKADGTKYGKTEGGALWLDPEMMSPYAFYQFWLNVEDEKVGELLRVFTFLAREEIEDARGASTPEKPFLRAGQKALAERRHDAGARRRGDRADPRPRPRRCSAAATSTGSSPRHPGRGAARGRRDDRGAATGCRRSWTCSSQTGLAKSKGEARRTIAEGGAYLNNERVEDPEAVVPGDRPDRRSWLVLRRGKKSFAGVEIR